jgi:plasmid stability protein
MNANVRILAVFCVAMVIGSPISAIAQKSSEDQAREISRILLSAAKTREDSAQAAAVLIEYYTSRDVLAGKGRFPPSAPQSVRAEWFSKKMMANARNHDDSLRARDIVRAARAGEIVVDRDGYVPLRLGMRASAVILLRGSPERINTTTTIAGMEAQQWVYANGTYFYFKNGVLTGIQESTGR